MTYQPQTTFAGGKSPFANCIQLRKPKPKREADAVVVKRPINKRRCSDKTAAVIQFILENPGCCLVEMHNGIPQYAAGAINDSVKVLYKSKRIIRFESENKYSCKTYVFFYEINPNHESNSYLYS